MGQRIATLCGNPFPHGFLLSQEMSADPFPIKG